MQAIENNGSARQSVQRTPKRLTPQETATLKRQEAVIERGLKTFYSVGEALNVIRSQRLYRKHFPNFRAYCIGRWGFGTAYADAVIRGANVVRNVESVAKALPSSEGVVRALTKYEPDLQRQIWQKAEELAPIPTDAIVKQAIAIIVPPEPENPVEQEQRSHDHRAVIEEYVRRSQALTHKWFELGDTPLTSEVRLVLKPLCRKAADALHDVLRML